MRKYDLPSYSQAQPRLRQMPDWANVVDEYNGGFIGAYFDETEYELARASVEESGFPFEWSDAASQFGMYGAADPNGTYLLHKEIEGCGLPSDTIAYASQPVGNCVSRGTQNALLHTLCAAVNHGEGSLPPEMFEAARESNPLSSEVLYWWKWPGTRPGSDGWYAGACLRVAKEKAGMVIRRDYRSIGGPDLRRETKSTTHAYASQSIPQTMLEIIHTNPLLAYSECSTLEEVADAIASGHAVQTDGGQGWESAVDENGVAKRKGSWSHSMCATGVCRTAAARKKYSTEGLILIQNSWGSYLKNSHAKVMGTNIGIPPGSFFARWEDCKNRSWFAVSSVHGWKNRKLPDWNMGELV